MSATRPRKSDKSCKGGPKVIPSAVEHPVYRCDYCHWWHTVRHPPVKPLRWTPFRELKDRFFSGLDSFAPKWTEHQKLSPYLLRKLGQSNVNGAGKFGGRVIRSFRTAEEGLEFLGRVKDPGEYELRVKLTRWREETISRVVVE